MGEVDMANTKKIYLFAAYVGMCLDLSASYAEQKNKHRLGFLIGNFVQYKYVLPRVLTFIPSIRRHE